MTHDTTWDFDGIGADTHSAQDNLAHPETTNAKVEAVLLESVGDAPTVPFPGDHLVQLPGGLYWDGELLRTAEVRELTGHDEEVLAALTGSIAEWMSVMLGRAVERIGDRKPTPAMIRKLLIGDRDALMLGVRIATFGPDITATLVCPHCDEQFEATVDLRTVESVVLAAPTPQHEHEVQLRGGGTAVVRLPDGAAQERIFADDAGNPAQRNTRLLTRCLVSLKDEQGRPVARQGSELAQGMGMADRQIVLRYLADFQPGPKLDAIRFSHVTCGEEVRLPLTLPDLFRLQ